MYQNGVDDYCAVSQYATFYDVGNDIHNDQCMSSDRCQLMAGSACVNRGSQYWRSDTRYYGLYDIDGGARIAGSSIDIGCDEVQ